ncbi:hypothetical protein SAMN04487900_11872 [Prevotella communis]|uniref:Uncharacterized protein n=1 Tax=Prevotella communis TaxID=2913614 RepID=A0A1H0J7X5_9BACT|nr:hypothetical protein SAMN04487900_11872 [Prevotella communis]
MISKKIPTFAMQSNQSIIEKIGDKEMSRFNVNMS